jgi:hypothetical protein
MDTTPPVPMLDHLLSSTVPPPPPTTIIANPNRHRDSIVFVIIIIVSLVILALQWQTKRLIVKNKYMQTQIDEIVTKYNVQATSPQVKHVE